MSVGACRVDSTLGAVAGGAKRVDLLHARCRNSHNTPQQHKMRPSLRHFRTYRIAIGYLFPICVKAYFVDNPKVVIASSNEIV